MSNPLIIVGASGFGKEVAWLAKRLDIEILGFLDDNKNLEGECFYNYPVLGNIDDWVHYSEVNFTIAIASPRVRKLIVNKMLLTGTPKFKTLIDPSVEVDKDEIEIGKGTIICAGSICTANIKIGHFSIINKQCSIGHDVIINDYCTLAPKVMLGGSVYIDIGVEIGASSNIRQQLIIEKGANIGMGSVVVNSVQANTLYFGAPAKKIKLLELFN
jgi:sugar O-acyltransferase (sialic acid O-acetyltransferase NeuD family)